MEDIKAVKRKYGIVGDSPRLLEAIRTALVVAPSNCSVLILGESGVGKENIARIIHDNSSRKHSAFVPINCGAIPEGMIDSALFGHLKGAFTGATEARNGYFETADKGTIFLDEVGDLPLQTQVRLLRVLESGEFIKVGDSKAQKADVRIIAATNADMASLVESGRFRSDLFYRLTAPIYVPALRDRKEDIEKLFMHFAGVFSAKLQRGSVRLTPEALQALQDYSWPGNIRQLLHVVESMTLMEETREITPGIFKKYVGYAPKAVCTDLVVAGRDTLEQHNYKLDGLLNVVRDLKSQLDNLHRQVEMLSAQVVQGESHWNVKSLPQPASTVMPGGAVPQENEVEEVEAAEVKDEDEPNLDFRNNEKELIVKALEATGGNRRAAAHRLNMNERTLYRKIAKYGL